MNYLPESEESSPTVDSSKILSVVSNYDRKIILIARRVIVSSCAGKELYFFFIPRRNAFKKRDELLIQYGAKIAQRYEPPKLEVDNEDTIEDCDFSGRTEFLLGRAQAKLAHKLMLSLPGSLQVMSHDEEYVTSFPLMNFGSYSALLRLLENPGPYDERRRARIPRKNPAKPDFIPVYFKMKATVPFK
jgi:hypothetical protein